MQRRRVYFAGRVQGVGFRYTTQQIAASFKVTGYVRNLPDRRVEMVVEGLASEIDQLIESISERMEQFISKVQQETLPATGEFSSFEVPP